MTTDTPQLKIYSQSEIEIFLSGDRREVERDAENEIVATVTTYQINDQV